MAIENYEAVTLVGGTHDGVRISVNNRENFIIMYERTFYIKNEDSTWGKLNEVVTMNKETYLRKCIYIENKLDRLKPHMICYFLIEGMEDLHGIELLVGNYKRNCPEG